MHITESSMRRRCIAVDIKSHHGIGAKLEWVLEILAFCEENKLTPVEISLDDKEYGKY